MASGDYVVRKPHPTIFLTAAQKLGTEPGDTWFVGDSPAFDVDGAKAAGMVSVLYAPLERPPGAAADLEISSWTELSERLGA